MFDVGCIAGRLIMSWRQFSWVFSHLFDPLNASLFIELKLLIPRYNYDQNKFSSLVPL